jgi:hypothetical protein
MKPTLLAAALAALAITTPASAQSVRCDTFGDMQTCTGPGGYRSTESTFGDVTTVFTLLRVKTPSEVTYRVRIATASLWTEQQIRSVGCRLRQQTWELLVVHGQR